MSADVRTGGYGPVASDGGVFSYDAPFLGSAGGLPLAKPVVGVNSFGAGMGYRMVAVTAASSRRQRPVRRRRDLAGA